MNVFNAYYNSRIVVPFTVPFLLPPGVYLGEVIDTAGYEACEFVLGAENIFAGFPVDDEVFESDDPAMPGGGTLVDDAHLLGSLSGLVLEDPLIRAGYIGKKQYIQLRITVPGGLAGGLWGICVLMNAWHQPTLKQPN